MISHSVERTFSPFQRVRVMDLVVLNFCVNKERKGKINRTGWCFGYENDFSLIQYYVTLKVS